MAAGPRLRGPELGGVTDTVLSRRALNRALLARQMLLERVDRPVVDVVEHLVPMQAQVPIDPYVALWSRIRGFDPLELSGMLERREAARGTLHRATLHLATKRDFLELRPLVQPVAERGFRTDISVDVPAAWADNSSAIRRLYYMIGDSLVNDGDLAYRQEDLFRYLNRIPSGPNGVFLKLGKTIAGAPDPDTTRLFFAKSFIYPLAAAPLVWALGANGFLVFNALLLSLTFFCAYQFLALRSPPVVAVLLAGAFLFATVTPAYTFWIMPELFNFALTVMAIFLWLYKLVARDTATPARGWLARPATDVVAALLLGIATFSKPSNILLAGPMVCWYFWHREWRRALTLGTVVVAVAVGFFAINTAVTGEWNYQGGQRNSFSSVDGKPFPFQTTHRRFRSRQRELA